VDVRLDAELLDEVDSIAVRTGATRSEVIREAVASHVMDDQDSFNSTVVKVTIPNRLAEKVTRHVMNGDARDAEEAVVLALERWTVDLEDYYLNRRDKINLMVAENVKNDAALKAARQSGREKLKR
jgi:metal-responsive CopG/Arc/MetJ family transcriptional regulator